MVGKDEILIDEREANIFAMELLMPKHFLENEEMLQRDVLDIEESEIVKRLAEKYQVSAQLMFMRLYSLGYVNL